MMFTPLPEFDYVEILQIQLEAMLTPLLDGRRGLSMDSPVVNLECSFEHDSGQTLVASLTLSFRP